MVADPISHDPISHYLFPRLHEKDRSMLCVAVFVMRVYNMEGKLVMYT